MAIQSSGANSQVAYIAETTFGTTPATPELVALPFTSWSLQLTKDEYEDNSIRANRQEYYSVSGNRHVTGDLDVNYSPLAYDAFLESLFLGSWTTNVLKIGSTPKSFTIEEGALDIGQYRVYTGVICDKLALTVPNDGIITAKFSLLGKDQSALDDESIDESGTITAAPVSEPLTHAGTGGFFKIGGAAVGYVTSLTLNIDNGFGQNFGLGVNTVRGFSPSFAKVTGTAEVFFEDAVAYNLFVNGTQSSIDFKLSNGVKSHQFTMPNVKFISADRTISGQGPIIMSFNFKALWDETAGSIISITRA